jgi:hypothetical protein
MPDDKYMVVSLHAELLDIYIRGYFTSFKGTGINLWETPSVKNSVIQFVATASSSIFTSIAGNKTKLMEDTPSGFSKNSQMWNTDYLSVGAEHVHVHEDWKIQQKPLLIFKKSEDFVDFDLLDYFVSAHLINLIRKFKSINYTDIIPKVEPSESLKVLFQNTELEKIKKKREYRSFNFRSFSTEWDTSETESSNERKLLFPMKHFNYNFSLDKISGRPSSVSLPLTCELFSGSHSTIDNTPKLFCCKIGQLFKTMSVEDIFTIYSSLLSNNTNAINQIMSTAVIGSAKELDEHVIFTDFYPTDKIYIDIDGKETTLKDYMEKNYIINLTSHLELYIYGNFEYSISHDDTYNCYRRILLVIYELLKRVLQYFMYESVVVYEEKKIEYCQTNLNCKSRIQTILEVLNGIINRYNDKCPDDTLKIDLLDFNDLTMYKNRIQQKLVGSWKSKITLRASYSGLPTRVVQDRAKKSRTAKGLYIKLKKPKKQRTRTKPKPKKQRTRRKPKHKNKSRIRRSPHKK